MQIDPVDSGSSSGDEPPPHPVIRASLRVPPAVRRLLYQIAVTTTSTEWESIETGIWIRGLSALDSRIEGKISKSTESGM
jgi:hypothetical protein